MDKSENIFTSETNFRKRYEYSNSDLLGEGGFAQVYKAYDKQFEEYVALKFYNKAEQGKYDVLHEMKDSRKFAHHNIIRVHDAFMVKFDSTGTESFVQVGVIELANGGNLRDFVKKKPSESQFINALIGILNGLEYLHSKKNIIHRDLSPENILMYKENDSYIPKIADFGISKKITAPGEDQDKSTQLLGKVDYMSPEQFYPEKFGINGRISTNVDLWAFGVIVYELFTHEKPFSKREPDNPMKIIQSITKNNIPEVEDIPDPYRIIIKKCLEKNANKRVQKPKELIHILENHLQNMNEFGVVSSPKKRSKGSLRPVLIAVISILVFSILAVSTYYFIQSRNNRALKNHQDKMEELMFEKKIEPLLTYYQNLPENIQSNDVITSLYSTAHRLQTNIDSLHDLGNVYFKAREYENAIYPYQEIIDNFNPNDEEARKRIILIKRINSNIDSLHNIGNEYYRTGQTSKAIDSYRVIINKFNPKDQKALGMISKIENQDKIITPPKEKSNVRKLPGKLYSEGMFSIRRPHVDSGTKLKAIRITNTSTIVYLEFFARDHAIEIHPVGSEGAYYLDYNNRQSKLLLRQIIGIKPGIVDGISKTLNVEFVFDKLPGNVKDFNMLEGENQLDESVTYWNYIGIKLLE